MELESRRFIRSVRMIAMVVNQVRTNYLGHVFLRIGLDYIPR
jgi:hypothetical protein